MQIKSAIILFILLFPSCKTESKCHLKEIKTIFYDKGSREYIHYVLIKDFDRKCMDSIQMIRIAKKYADTVKYGKPALAIKFYNSDGDFISGETSQPMDEINESCLVHISFDSSMRPVDFIFYGDNGDIVYWGNKWRPKG